MLSRKLAEERAQVNSLIQQKGWLTILRELTPLTRAIDNYSDSKTKIGRPVACDIAPCHSSASGRKFYLMGNANETGYGRCWVCGEVVDPYEIIIGFNGGTFKDAYELVKDSVGYNSEDGSYSSVPYTKPVYQPRPVEEPTEAELASFDRQRKAMAQLWEEAYSLDDPRSGVALDYLSKRGMLSIPNAQASIAFHPSVPYFQKIDDLSRVRNVTQDAIDERDSLVAACESSPYFLGFQYKGDVIVGAKMGSHPTLLLMLRDKDFNPRRVLKVYLNQDGDKLDLPRTGHFSIKKVCFAQGETERLQGAAVYLDAPNEYVMIAEGFETVGVTRGYVKMPSASTFNSSGMGSYEAPDGVKVIFPLVDKDNSKAGHKAVFKLMNRYLDSGVMVIPVFISAPVPEGATGIDWADVLNEPGGEELLPEFIKYPDAGWNWKEMHDAYYERLKDMSENKWQ